MTLVAFFLIGLSSTLTGLYLNQNARSLLHRYRTQERRIEQWLANYDQLLSKLGNAKGEVDHTILAPVVREILAFEDLMVDELIDWIAITEDDVMELSPS